MKKECKRWYIYCECKTGDCTNLFLLFLFYISLLYFRCMFFRCFLTYAYMCVYIDESNFTIVFNLNINHNKFIYHIYVKNGKETVCSVLRIKMIFMRFDKQYISCNHTTMNLRHWFDHICTWIIIFRCMWYRTLIINQHSDFEGNIRLRISPLRTLMYWQKNCKIR